MGKREILRNSAAAAAVAVFALWFEMYLFVDDCHCVETPEAHGLLHLMREALLGKTKEQKIEKFFSKKFHLIFLLRN